MSDEHLENDLDVTDEYEEISSDEVDRVVESLEELAESVSSENIRALLEEASQNVYDLVYDEEDEIEAEADDTEELLAGEELIEEEVDEDPAAEAA